MKSFVQRFCAVHWPGVDVAVTLSVSNSPDQLASSIADLTAAVVTLAADHQELLASLISSPSLSEQPHQMTRATTVQFDFRGRGDYPLPEAPRLSMVTLCNSDVTIATCFGISPGTAYGTFDVICVLDGTTFNSSVPTMNSSTTLRGKGKVTKDRVCTL